MDYFSLSKMKKMFSSGGRWGEWGGGPLFYGCFGLLSRVSGQVGGWAPPAFLVLSFNTNEEELVMRAFREEHSVKTAARESIGID